MSSPLPMRLALVGLGRWGRLWAKTLSARGELAGIAVATADSARRATAEFGVHADTSLARLFTRVQPDGVLVFSPTPAHVEHAEFALERSLPCLLAKPAADTVEGARRLHAESLRRGVPLLVAQEHAWSPGLRAALLAAEAGRVGEVACAALRRYGDGDSSSGAAARPMPEVPGQNFAWLRDTLMHDLAVLGRLAGGGLPVEVVVRRAFASAAHPILDVSVRWPSAFVGHLEWDGSPGRPFEVQLDIEGRAGRVRFHSRVGASRAEVVRVGTPPEVLRVGRGAREALLDELRRVAAGGEPHWADTASASADAMWAAAEVTAAVMRMVEATMPR